MKTVLKACFIAIMASVVLWSCKDDFTDEDLLNKQDELGKDSIQLSIVVYNGSTSFVAPKGSSTSGSAGNSGGKTSSTEGLKDLTVSLNINGVITTRTTDDNGIAVFTNVQQGTIGGTVKGTNFTTTNFTIKVTEGKNENGSTESSTYASALIPVFETSGANTATVSGKVTCETNLLNNTQEAVPNGTKVTFSINTTSKSFFEYYNGEGSDTYPGADLPNSILDYVGNTSIEQISFEGNFVATVTNGAYSIQLPVAHHGLEYSYTFGDFAADQSIAVDAFLNELSGSVRDVRTISTSFKMNANYVSNSDVVIPYVSPIQVDIAAPPAAGSGAAITARLLPTAVAIGTGATGFTVLASGSGYPANSTTIPVTITGGDFDNTVPGATAAVLTATSNALGVITSINGTLGNAYRSQATLTIGGGGAGAVVKVNYQSSVAPFFGTGTLSTITSAGTNYAVAPNVIFTGFKYTGEQVNAVETAILNNGTVVNSSLPAQTFASAPTVVVIPQERDQPFGYGSANNSGQLTSININSSGSGYNPLLPPAVTIRDLKGGGTGATAVAITNTSGSIQTLQLLTRGSGYNSFGNANFPSNYISFQTDGDYEKVNNSNVYAVKLIPGATKIINAYYGTGVHSQPLYNND